MGVATAAAPLGEWETIADPQSGRPYYVNRVTGQTSWSPPPTAMV